MWYFMIWLYLYKYKTWNTMVVISGIIWYLKERYIFWHDGCDIRYHHTKYYDCDIMILTILTYYRDMMVVIWDISSPSLCRWGCSVSSGEDLTIPVLPGLSLSSGARTEHTAIVICYILGYILYSVILMCVCSGLCSVHGIPVCVILD